jgi:hypothetical protein
MSVRECYVYMMTNASRTGIYTGVTNDLARRRVTAAWFPCHSESASPVIPSPPEADEESGG